MIYKFWKPPNYDNELEGLKYEYEIWINTSVGNQKHLNGTTVMWINFFANVYNIKGKYST
jgi:hypothetical protein